jgi:phenylalanyl-tRNA synthetase beta chain
MIVTYKWLQEFVEFDLSTDELAHRLTMAGLEVDMIEYVGAELDSVIVAKLISVDQHPDADRLTVCQVDNGTEQVQVVCGATNHKTGDLIALAQVGSVLPGDFKIKKSKIRGQLSQGMLCSEKELGLSDESAGIMILPAGLTLGQPVFAALDLKDVCFELGLTPNRADCLSVVGVAREVAAMVSGKLKLPEPVLMEEGGPIEPETSVEIVDTEKCPRYAARLIKNIKIGPSPDWLIHRLETIGLRSINNVVDVTNYVMMELGQPLHAFDFNLLRGNRIVVRCPGVTEFTTLDGQSHQLNDSDLAICDAEGPVALAGIMGGENSEIQTDTATVLLESAFFDPISIRRTSKRLGLHTDSSHRFERGCDVNIVPIALNRAAALIAELAGGTVCKGMIDVYPTPIELRQVNIGLKKTNTILGLNLTLAQIKRHLQSIGLSVVTAEETESLLVEIPTFRPDLEREIDLIEEVARLNGYEHIPVTMPVGQTEGCRVTAEHDAVAMLREKMVAAGFSEVVNYSFVPADADDRILLPTTDPRRNHTAVLNPLTEVQAVMRTSLVPSILENVSRNQSYRTLDLNLFELRPVFFPVSGQDLPQEPKRLTAIMCGSREPLGWCQDSSPTDFYQLKGVAEDLLEAMAISNVQWDASDSEPYLHPGKSCSIVSGGKRLGVVGEIHPQVAVNYDISSALFVLEFDVSTLMQAADNNFTFKPISKFPDVYRDSAFLIDHEVSAEAILSTLQGTKSNLIENITLFDVYSGKGIPEGKKSVAIRVNYRSNERTLTDEEITKVHNRLVKTMDKSLSAQLR